MTSMRQVAQAIDYLYPPASLRELAGRFRHENVPFGTIPAGGVSLGNLSNRLLAADVKPLRLIHYNCWLIEVNLGPKEVLEVFGNWSELLTCIGINFVDALARVLEETGVDAFCNALFPNIKLPCTSIPDPLNIVCKATGKAALELARFALNVAGKTINEIFYILSIPDNVIFDALGITIRVHSAPSLDERAFEIGKVVTQAYDVVSLCEVWTPNSVKRILSGGQPENSVEQTEGFIERVYGGRYFTGPKRPVGSWQNKDSGLLVLVPDLDVTDGGNERYHNDGLVTEGCDFGPLFDTDRWAVKGVQLTHIDTGMGVIDLYSTHLYSGGDPIIPSPSGTFALLLTGPILQKMLEGVTDESRAIVQRDQIHQLCEFIAKNRARNPSHLTIVVGDFNVPGRYDYGNPDPRQHIDQDGRYGYLIDEMGKLGLDDWWTMLPFAKLRPIDYTRGGVTNRHGDGDPPIIYRFDRICKAYDVYKYSHLFDYKFYGGKPHTVGLPAPSDAGDYCDYFCDDAENSDPHPDPDPNAASLFDGQRIDYIFIERPTASHNFFVEVTRLRRRSFRRNNSQWATTPERADDEAWTQVNLSDHLGLEVTLHIRPK